MVANSQSSADYGGFSGLSEYRPPPPQCSNEALGLSLDQGRREYRFPQQRVRYEPFYNKTRGLSSS